MRRLLTNHCVAVYDIDGDGKLINPSEIMSTKGKVACHITVHKGNIYCANYISGSVVMLPDKLVEHEGTGLHPTRQEGPHVHYIGATPEGKYICAADLGLDTIFLYEPNLTLFSKVSVPKGHGVRHLAFSEDGKYLFAVNELKSTVSVFLYNEGMLELLDTQTVLSPGVSECSIAAAIRIHNNRIYISNRGHDSISVLRFEDNKLEVVDNINCRGQSPRDFIFTERYLICTNQASNQVTILDEENNFVLKECLEIEEPICVCANNS